MKKATAILFFTLAAVITLSCNKENNINKEGIEFEYKCVKGKILRGWCYSVVLEVMSPGINIGGGEWKDYKGNKWRGISYGTYNNVASVINICTASDLICKYPESSIVYFDLLVVKDPSKSAQDYDREDCNYCQGTVDDSPNTRIVVANILQSPCQPEKK